MKPYVVLAPFSCHPIREWPAQNWRELARLLIAGDLDVHAIGSSVQRSQLEATFDGSGASWHYGNPAKYVCDLIRRAGCVVANDSGPAHVGGMLDVATVCVHAGSLPHAYLFDTAPSVVSVTSERSLPRADHQVEALHSIPVSRVYEAVRTAAIRNPPHLLPNLTGRTVN